MEYVIYDSPFSVDSSYKCFSEFVKVTTDFTTPLQVKSKLSKFMKTNKAANYEYNAWQEKVHSSKSWLQKKTPCELIKPKTDSAHIINTA